MSPAPGPGRLVPRVGALVSGTVARAVATTCARLAALALCACAGALVTPDAPKVVTGYAIASWAVHEECMHLADGDRVEYAFTATEPVAFNIHYHEGRVVVMPLVRDGTQGDAGMYSPRDERDYCLMWEAGPAGAVLDYRVRLKPAERGIAPRG